MLKTTVFVFFFSFALLMSDESKTKTGEEFALKIIGTYIKGDGKIAFKVADTVIALDNGETISKIDLGNAWSDITNMAFHKKPTLNEFREKVKIEAVEADGAKKHIKKKAQKVYKYEKGDLVIDASKEKDEKNKIIKYKKGFIFLIRKVKDEWVLLGIGG